MKTSFAFGITGIDIELPDSFDCHIVTSPAATLLPDPVAAVNLALDQPIGCESLTTMAAGKTTAAISVCDITRPAPNPVTLPPILQRLADAGIPADHITILIATGLHRQATADEVLRIVGSDVAAHYQVVSHDAHALDQHRPLGHTLRGTSVAIDERFMAADLHITLGLVEPHLMLGFSGGRKLVAPGLAAEQTIKAIHSPRFMREPLATEGSIQHNPLQDELLEIARMARHDFIVDVTLTRHREISGVFAGDPVKAHAAAVQFLEQTSVAHIDELADAVITSAAGYPLDLTFYQTIKGITAAQHIAKPGAPILIVSECAEGVGSDEFASKLAAYAGPQQYLDEILHNPVQIDQWQLEKLAITGLKHRLLFYTPGVSASQLGTLGATAFSHLDRAIAALVEMLPTNARIALVPDGPYTFARARQTSR